LRVGIDARHDVGEHQPVGRELVGELAGLTGREVVDGALLVGRERCLAEEQVDARAQRSGVPARSGVGAVEQRPAAGVDPYRQGLDRVVGAAEPDHLVGDLDGGGRLDDVPHEGRRQLTDHRGRQGQRLGGAVDGQPLGVEHVAHSVAQQRHVEPVVGVGVAQHHGVEVGDRCVPLQVGETPRPQVDDDGRAGAAHEVAAARAVGTGVRPRASEHGEV
jgi:hypothetical protein